MQRLVAIILGSLLAASVASATVPVPTASPPGFRITAVDARDGAPRFLEATRTAAPAAKDPIAAARLHLAALRGVYRLDDEAFASLAFDASATHGDRPVLVQVRQSYQGREVLGARMTLVLRRDLSLVAVSGNVSAAHPPRDAGQQKRATIDAGAAESLARAALAARGATTPLGAARSREVWYPTDGALEAAWVVELRASTGRRTLGEALVFSARDGRLLERRNLMSDATNTYRVWADAGGDNAPMDGPQGDGATPHPTGTPNGFAPPAVARNLISISSSQYRPNDPWLPNGAAQLEGNNAFVYADRGPDGFDAGDTLITNSNIATFDHAYDPALAHDANPFQIQAAGTQGFYVVNWLHDWFYAGGFDERAGNAQESNFGRGGFGHDPLLLETQDPSTPDNANAWAPSDGGSPIIQMGVWHGDTARSAAFVGSGGLNASFGRSATGGADFGPPGFSVSAPLIAPVEVADVSGNPKDGCDPPFVSAAQVVGKIALVDRGTCYFIDKARNLQAAGAVGVIAVNHLPASDAAGGAFTMALPDGEVDDVTIPILMLSKEDGDPIRAALGGQSITATLTRTAGPSLDSTVDTTILTHEWGHTLNNRLMDLGSENGTQIGGMDEGYADFVSLLVHVGEQSGPTAYQGAHPTAAYSAQISTDDGYYFGIRRYPYSTDMTKDPLTFKYIEDGVALPSGIPSGPSGSSNSEVHNVGEVWAVMLWECYVALLRDGRYSYSEARERMRDYLVDAQKATPRNPNFTEARDAWLAVTQARDEADRTLFAAAFAKRGLGQGAVAPPQSSATNSTPIESYVPVPRSGGGGGATDALSLLLLLAVARARRRYRASSATR